MTIRKLLLLSVLAASCLSAQETGQKPSIEVTKTERVDFPSGGVLHLMHSIGDLNIEAWDNPGVEITTIKSTKGEYSERNRANAAAELEKVTVVAERHGNEVAIKTDYPRHKGFLLAVPVRDSTRFHLEYHISVPRNAKLVIDHGIGAVNVDGVTGDIKAALLQGEIMLHLPENAPYNIDAKSELGNVNSDFPGEKGRKWLRQRAMQKSARPAQNLNLRVGIGDIVLLRIRVPKTPEPIGPGASRSGS